MSRIAFTAAAAHVATVGIQLRYSGACRCPARQHPGCEGAAPTTERAQAVWMRQQHRIQTGPLLHPRAHHPAPTRPCPAPRRCRPRPTGAAPGSVGAARHRPPVARAQTGKTHDTGSAPGVTQASVAAAAPRCPCTLTRLLAPRRCHMSCRSRLRGFVLRHLNYSVLYPGSFGVFPACNRQKFQPRPRPEGLARTAH